MSLLDSANAPSINVPPPSSGFSLGGILSSIGGAIQTVITSPTVTTAAATYLDYQKQRAAQKASADAAQAQYEQRRDELNFSREKLYLDHGVDPSGFLASKYSGATPDPLYFAVRPPPIPAAAPTVATNSIPQSYVIAGLVGLAFLLLRKGR